MQQLAGLLPQRVATRTAGHRYNDGTGHTVASLAVIQALNVQPTRTNPSTMYALPQLSEYNSEAPFEDEKNGAASFSIRSLRNNANFNYQVTFSSSCGSTVVNVRVTN